MRQPKYLSPTSIAQFYADRDEFYLKYLADNRPPRLPQTQPMAIGSSFDAYVKNYLYERLFGVNHDPKFGLQKIFEDQVETHNRAWAWEHGNYVFKCYKESGALSDLILQLEAAQGQPRFEFTVEALIGGVPLLGKPDVYFVSRQGARIIIDWKVNGYCANRSTSPKKGFINCRDTWVGKQTRGNNMPHKDAQPMLINGMMVNAAGYFEHVDISWTNQLAVYAWLVGEPVGGDFIVGIDQIISKGMPPKPQLRVAQHRAKISALHQEALIKSIQDMWSVIKTGYIFDNVSRDESDDRCKTLDGYYAGLDEGDSWFNQATRGS
ncbi:MAG: hypothetical protein DRP08_01040 [Candidatus Aenigmatarchaeota archaeon]|nr:MAG: hypothetical protein DRP08_01040 [Candidatus Aenigmarchaeota archaeon]